MSQTPSQPLALEVVRLHLASKKQLWRTPKVLLDDVSFALPQGQVLAFLGHNGAGKTTTLRVLLGLLRPSAGEARLFGVAAGSPRSRVGLGFLPERAYYPPALTATEFVTAHARLAGLAGLAAAREVARALARVQLQDHAHRRLGHFSKGMLQRAGLAQALLAGPRLLLLDEPFSGLDPLGRQQVRTLLQEERERGCSIVLCTHVLADAEALCDRAVVLRRGSVEMDGPVQALLQPEGGVAAAVDVVVAPLATSARAALAPLAAAGPFLATLAAAETDRPVRLVAKDLAQANALVDAIRQVGGTLLQLQPQQRSLSELFAAGK